MSTKQLNWSFALVPGYVSLSYHPDGEHILISSSENPSFKIIDQKDEENHLDVDAHNEGIYDIKISNSGDKIVTCSSDHTVKQFNYPQCSESSIITRFESEVHCVDISICDSLIACGSIDGLVKIVTAVDTTQIRKIKAHDGSVRSLSFDPKREYLVTSGSDGKVKIWNYSHEDKLEATLDILPQTTSVFKHFNRMSWNPDGSVLAVPTSLGIFIIERNSWKIILKLTDHKQESINVVWSPNGKYLISSHTDNSIVVWDYDTKTSLERKKHDSLITGLTWCPKDNKVVLGDEHGQFSTWSNVIPKKMQDPVKALASRSDTYIDQKKAVESMFDDFVPESQIVDSQYVDTKETYDDIDDNFIQDEIQVTQEKTRKIRDVDSVTISAIPDTSTPMQEPFQPSSSPISATRRYLVWNAIGSIIVRHDDSSYLEVEFSDLSRFKNFTLTKSVNISMGSLCSTGMILASSGKEDSRSLLMYQSFNSLGANAEWVHYLGWNENVELVAVGHDFVACVTSKRYLRIFTSGGIQTQIMCIAGQPVSLVAQGSLLALFYHTGPTHNYSQTIGYQLFNVSQKACVSQGPIPLGEGATLDWVGFSQENVLTIFDSDGVLKQLTGHTSIDNTFIHSSRWIGQWVPILDVSSVLPNGQKFWPINVSIDKMRYVPCSEYEGAPHVLPRPVPSFLPLEVPVINNDTTISSQEENYIRYMISYNHLLCTLKDVQNIDQRLTADNKDIKVAHANLDQIYLRLIKASCEEEKIDRALGLAKELNLRQSLRVAISIAKATKQTILYEKLVALLAERDEEKKQREIHLSRSHSAIGPMNSISDTSDQHLSISSNADKGNDSEVRKKRGTDDMESQSPHATPDLEIEIMPTKKKTKTSDIDSKATGSILKSNPFTKVNPTKSKDTHTSSIFDTLGL